MRGCLSTQDPMPPCSVAPPEEQGPGCRLGLCGSRRHAAVNLGPRLPPGAQVREAAAGTSAVAWGAVAGVPVFWPKMQPEPLSTWTGAGRSWDSGFHSSGKALCIYLSCISLLSQPFFRAQLGGVRDIPVIVQPPPLSSPELSPRPTRSSVPLPQPPAPSACHCESDSSKGPVRMQSLRCVSFCDSATSPEALEVPPQGSVSQNPCPP